MWYTKEILIIWDELWTFVQKKQTQYMQTWISHITTLFLLEYYVWLLRWHMAQVIFLLSCVQITDPGAREPVGFLIDWYCYVYNIRPHTFFMFQALSLTVVSLVFVFWIIMIKLWKQTKMTVWNFSYITIPLLCALCRQTLHTNFGASPHYFGRRNRQYHCKHFGLV